MGLRKQERNQEAHQHTGSNPKRKQDVYKGKYCYDSFLFALAVCDQMAKRNPQYRYTLYECGECDYIHVGRMPPDAVFYFEGDEPVIPPLVKPPTQPHKQPVTAIPKSQKRKIMAAHGLIPARGKGLDKVPKARPWETILQHSTERRGYTPFEGLKDLNFAVKD